MISLISNWIMIIASEFWLSSPWLLVMLLESPSLRQLYSVHCWRDWRTDAKRRSVYPLAAVVKLNKFWSTLRFFPYLWDILAPLLRDIPRFILWASASDLNGWMDYYYTESKQCQYTLNIGPNKNLLYKILRNTRTINITHVNTSISFHVI